MKKILFRNSFKRFFPYMLPALLIAFNSCIGISTDIQMNEDGSGRITMEYKISKILDSLGALDGNESMPPVPVSRTDWERTVSRIPDARLVSHSKRETTQDTIISAVIEFNNSAALAAVLSASNDLVSVNYAEKSGAGSFNMIINNENANYDIDLFSFMKPVFSDYNISFSFTASGNSTMIFTDGYGNAIPAPSSAITVLSGRRVSMSMNVINVLNQMDGLGVRVNW